MAAVFRFFIATLFAFVAGCSGSSDGAVTTTSSASPAADLTGAWIGRATSSGVTINVSADLVQTGSSLSGSVRAPGACIGGGKIEGSIAGDSLSATVTSGDVIVMLNMTVSSSEQLDGTFDVPPSGVCPAQRGSISLTRK